MIEVQAHSPSPSARTAVSGVAQYRQSFAEDGFLVWRGVVSREKLEHLHRLLLEEFAAAKASGRLFSGGGNLAGHLNCSPGEAARFAYGTLVDAGIIEVIRALSAKVARLPNVGCNFNLPGSVTQHWHMDRPYTRDFMIANVAVVDTDLGNGAIDVLPGSHRRFYKYWQLSLERATRRLVSKRVPLQQGDVLVRTSSLWHRGMPNHTSAARPMLAFTWEDGGSVLADPFQAESGKVAFRPNWYGPSLLGRLRERTYVVAPITHDAYRFARSLIGTKGYDH